MTTFVLISLVGFLAMPLCFAKWPLITASCIAAGGLIGVIVLYFHNEKVGKKILLEQVKEESPKSEK